MSRVVPSSRTARTRYTSALRAYVSTSFGRPLERLAVFFEGVAEAVAAGARDHEVCYRQAFSKHELKKVLALYPAHEGTVLLYLFFLMKL